MKQIIEIIAQSLVDHPESVVVTEIEGNSTSILELKVAKSDIGQVVGKQGRIAQAIRTILSAVSARQNKRAVLEIVEDYGDVKFLHKLKKVQNLVRTGSTGQLNRYS